MWSQRKILKGNFWTTSSKFYSSTVHPAPPDMHPLPTCPQAFRLHHTQPNNFSGIPLPPLVQCASHINSRTNYNPLLVGWTVRFLI
jgi:hypothetical protein